jgi:hypothetical protein
MRQIDLTVSCLRRVTTCTAETHFFDTCLRGKKCKDQSKSIRDTFYTLPNTKEKFMHFGGEINPREINPEIPFDTKGKSHQNTGKEVGERYDKIARHAKGVEKIELYREVETLVENYMSKNIGWKEDDARCAILSDMDLKSQKAYGEGERLELQLRLISASQPHETQGGSETQNRPITEIANKYDRFRTEKRRRFYEQLKEIGDKELTQEINKLHATIQKKWPSMLKSAALEDSYAFVKTAKHSLYRASNYQLRPLSFLSSSKSERREEALQHCSRLKELSEELAQFYNEDDSEELAQFYPDTSLSTQEHEKLTKEYRKKIIADFNATHKRITELRDSLHEVEEGTPHILEGYCWEVVKECNRLINLWTWPFKDLKVQQLKEVSLLLSWLNEYERRLKPRDGTEYS